MLLDSVLSDSVLSNSILLNSVLFVVSLHRGSKLQVKRGQQRADYCDRD